MNRRDFITASALSGGSALLLGAIAAGAKPAAAAPDPSEKRSPRQLKVAGLQMLVSNDWARNEATIHRAIDKAAQMKTDFLLTPEGSVSGYHTEFDRRTVAGAIERLARHGKESKVGLILGTCYKEEEQALRRWQPADKPAREEFCYDQVRVYAPTGEFLGSYSKTLLGGSLVQPGTGEMRSYVSGTPRTFSWNGVCFGVLICNDLFATPGSTTTPNPYLPWQLKQMGAEVIFHAVNSGTVPRYRPFHESSQALWAWALNIPVVTTNATREGNDPVNCRAGVFGADGERLCVAPDTGEQVFYQQLTLA